MVSSAERLLSRAHRQSRYGGKCVTSVNILLVMAEIVFTRRTQECLGTACRREVRSQESASSNCNVRWSRSPSKYRASTRSNTEPDGETAAKSVAHDLSFKSSGEPKMS